MLKLTEWVHAISEEHRNKIQIAEGSSSSSMIILPLTFIELISNQQFLLGKGKTMSPRSALITYRDLNISKKLQ